MYFIFYVWILQSREYKVPKGTPKLPWAPDYKTEFQGRKEIKEVRKDEQKVRAGSRDFGNIGSIVA